MCFFALPTGQHVWFSLPPGGNLGYGQEAMADCLMTQCNFQSCRFPFLEDSVGLMVTPRVGSLPRIHRENRGQNGDLMRWLVNYWILWTLNGNFMGFNDIWMGLNGIWMGFDQENSWLIGDLWHLWWRSWWYFPIFHWVDVRFPRVPSWNTWGPTQFPTCSASKMPSLIWHKRKGSLAVLFQWWSQYNHPTDVPNFW